VLNPENGTPPCKPKDYYCYAKTMYEWVKTNILYVYDPHLVEYLERPSVLLKTRIGDCDSQDILLSAIYQHMGFETQWVTIAADPSRPDEFSHVYIRVNIPKVGWVVADSTMPKKWFGWEAESYIFKRYWHGASDQEGTPLDKSDSIKVEAPAMSSTQLSGLGHGGHGGGHHHGGHHGRSGGGWYGGGGWGWGPYSYPYVVVVEGQVPTTDQVAILPPEDLLAAEMEMGLTESMASLPRPPSANIGYLGDLGKRVKPVKPRRVARQRGIAPISSADFFSDPGLEAAKKHYAAGGGQIVGGHSKSLWYGQAGLGGMGASNPSAEPAVMDILSGKTLKSIKGMKADIDATIIKLDAMQEAINGMPAGAKKSEAQAKYNQANAALTQQFTIYQKTRSQYNDFITSAKGYAGTIPGLDSVLPGLAIPLVPIVAAIAGIVALAALANAVANNINAYNKVPTKGYIDQLASMLEATGTVIKEGTSAMSTMAWIAGIGLLGYLAYTYRGDIGKLFGGSKKRA